MGLISTQRMCGSPCEHLTSLVTENFIIWKEVNQPQGSSIYRCRVLIGGHCTTRDKLPHIGTREIGTETCEVDDVFSPNKLWFGSDTKKRIVRLYKFYI